MQPGMDMPGSDIWISLPSTSGKESVNWFPRATSTRAIRSLFQWNYSALEAATMASEIFEAQVAILVRVSPHVATWTCFALNGEQQSIFSFETYPASRWTSIWCICRLRIERPRSSRYDLRWVVLPRRFTKQDPCALIVEDEFSGHRSVVQGGGMENGSANC